MKIDKDEFFFKKLGERIREERLKRNFSQTKLANAVNKDYTVIATYESGKNRIPVDTLIRISNFFKIPLTKFLKFDDSNLIPYSNHDELYDNLSENADTIKINVYSEVGAGNFVDFTSENPITEIYLRKEFYKKGMVAVKVKGESMSPTIKENGYVGIDIIDKEYIEGKIYAVYLPDEGLAIKRVFKSDGKIILKSDNPLFLDREVLQKNIKNDNFIIGRVKWVMQEI